MTEPDPSVEPAPAPAPLPAEAITADPGLLGDVVERAKDSDPVHHETRDRK